MSSDRPPGRLKVLLSYSGHVDPKVVGQVRHELDKYSDVVELRQTQRSESREDAWKHLTRSILEADAVVVISGSTTPIAGVLVECAFARAEGKAVTVVSPTPRE